MSTPVAPSTDYSQDHLHKQILEYFTATSVKLDEEDDLTTKLGFSYGLCYGISVVYAAFNATGQGEWYKQALRAIADWDKTRESLESEPELPPTGRRKLKLREVFERIINFFVFHNMPSTIDARVSQQSFLRSSFDTGLKVARSISSSEWITPSPDNYCSVTFSVTPEHFKRILSAESTIDTMQDIFIIFVGDHIVCARKNGRKFIYYDSNVRAYEITFDNVIDLAEQILLTAKYFSDFNIQALSLRGTRPAIAIGADYLHSPLHFEYILKSLGLHNLATSDHELLSEILCKIDTMPIDGPCGLQAFINASARLNERQRNLVQIMLEYTPESFVTFYQKIRALEARYPHLAIPEIMFDLMSHPDVDGKTGFYLAYYRYPSALREAYSLVPQILCCESISSEKLACTLQIRISNGCSLFSFLSRYFYENGNQKTFSWCIDNIIEGLEPQESARVLINLVFDTPNAFGLIGLDYIANYFPETLPKILQAIAKPGCLHEILLRHDSGEKSRLEVLLHYFAKTPGKLKSFVREHSAELLNCIKQEAPGAFNALFLSTCTLLREKLTPEETKNLFTGMPSDWLLQFTRAVGADRCQRDIIADELRQFDIATKTGFWRASPPSPPAPATATTSPLTFT